MIGKSLESERDREEKKKSTCFGLTCAQDPIE